VAGKFDRDRYAAAQARQSRARLLAEGTPVPARITTALDVRGLYGPEVDRACGVQEPAVDLWEAGELVPTAEQVKALAALTGYPVEFFYLPVAPEELGITFVCSRSGPRGKRCQVIDTRPDASVTELPTGQLALFGES
jgi:hypothetical protein